MCPSPHHHPHPHPSPGQIGLTSFSFSFLRWRVHLQNLHPNWTLLTLVWTLVPFSDCAVWSCIAIEMWCLFKLPSFLCENNWASMAWKTWSRFVKIDDKNMSQNKIATLTMFLVRQQRHLVKIHQSFTRQCAFLDNVSQLITFVHQHFISNFAIKNSSTAKNHLPKQSFSPNIYIVTTSFS